MAEDDLQGPLRPEERQRLEADALAEQQKKLHDERTAQLKAERGEALARKAEAFGATEETVGSAVDILATQIAAKSLNMEALDTRRVVEDLEKRHIQEAVDKAFELTKSTDKGEAPKVELVEQQARQELGTQPWAAQAATSERQRGQHGRYDALTRDQPLTANEIAASAGNPALRERYNRQEERTAEQRSSPQTPAETRSGRIAPPEKQREMSEAERLRFQQLMQGYTRAGDELARDRRLDGGRGGRTR